MTDRAEDCDWSFGDDVPEGQPTLPQPRLDPRDYKAGALFGGCYEIKGRLGRGGMGVVYRAHDRTSGREVAIKLLTQTLDARSRERFRREGELTAALRHPGIVRVHAGGELQQTPYLVYELVEGSQTLVALMAERHRDTLIGVLGLVADAVGYAHQQGVTHRDLKPENVLIDPEGNPRVADFGLARATGDSHLTRTGSLVGTPAFMSPEQVTGQRGKVGPACDVWALGVMLYQALTGNLPFRASTLPELSVAIVQKDPEPPRLVDPSVSPGLEAVCLKALRKESATRYADAGAFAADLRRALARQSTSGDSMPGRLSAWSRTQRGPIAVVIVVLAVALAAILVPGFEPGVSAVSDRRSAEEERVLALAFQAQGQHSEAAEAFGRALAAGALGELAFDQARAHWQAGELEESERACRVYLASHRDARGLALLVRVLLARGQAGFAEQTAEALAREHPGAPAQIVRAEVAEALGRDAKPILRAALKDWPESVEPRLALGRLHLAEGEVFAARALLSEERGGTEALRGLIDALLAQPPDVPRLQAASPPLAASCARWLLREGTRDVVLARRRQLAGALGLPARTRRARAALEAALAVSKDAREQGLAELGLGLLAPVESDEARDRAGRACAALPREPRAIRLRAAVSLARGQATRALADLDAAVALGSPEPASATLLRARAVLAAGGVPESTAVLEAEPESAAALLAAARAAGRDAWAVALEGRLEEREERRGRARALFEKKRLAGEMSPAVCRDALALDPGYVKARLTLGTQRFLRGEHLEGIRDALAAVERQPVDLTELCGQMLTFGWASKGMFGNRSLSEIVGGPEGATRGDEATLFLFSAAAEFEGKSEWRAPAVGLLSDLIERDPALVWPRVLRAILRAREDRLDEADDDLRVVLEIEPALGVGWFGKAVVEARRDEDSSLIGRHLAEAQRLGFLLQQHKELLQVAYPQLIPHIGRR